MIPLGQGLLPPPPQELQGRDLGVEYLSIMATAQKMVAVSGIQQTSQYALSLIPLDPTVGDKINTAKAIEKLADAVGVDVEILRTEEEVQQIRAQRQKQAQQQQALQTGMAAAQGAKALSVADTSGDNALTRILGPVAAAQASGQ